MVLAKGMADDGVQVKMIRVEDVRPGMLLGVQENGNIEMVLAVNADCSRSSNPITTITVLAVNRSGGRGALRMFSRVWRAGWSVGVIQ